ncbi:hypothetical protein PsPphi15_gp01 [Pseudomonas phage phi15]|uniref:Uncharacterized protein n=1 Tax=Pseudomonas phage phi15 TaxID=988656 RepID=F0V6W2_9CAUD|nr:hypothetical protein PsPphi15_gp01 [Pseudomonas phage phi15]CBZ41974.1 hypothetical protein [Pseudomonas phage phi15]
MSMKITPKHYDTLKGLFESALRDEVERLKGREGLPQTVKALIEHHEAAYKQGGLTERRMRFDLYWWVNRRRPELHEWSNEVYRYANDDHKETAIKRVLQELKAG